MGLAVAVRAEGCDPLVDTGPVLMRLSPGLLLLLPAIPMVKLETWACCCRC